MKNINRKYDTKGMATRTTSRGLLMIYKPLKENITIIVNNKPMRAIGLIRFTNVPSYHSFPFFLMSVYRVIIPVIKGIPRKIKTLLAISMIDTVT